MHKLALTLVVAALAPCLAPQLGTGPASAQSQKPVLGILWAGSPPAAEGPIVEGLRALGYKDGEALVIETRWAHSDITRFQRLTQELVERRPAVIVAPCGPSLRAIREHSRMLPVIAYCADEENFRGEVASFAQPGGHTTGVMFFSPESVGKRLELLREIIPGLSRLAVLYDSSPDDPIASHWRELERLQSVFGLDYQRIPVARVEEFEPAFEALARDRAQGLFVFPSNLMVSQATSIAELARKHRIASVFEFAHHVDAGGLLAYGGSISEVFGKAIPLYVDKILKGAKPAELPILQPTQLELVVNLRTAREIGLEIPPLLLLRADRVIE